MQRQILFAVEEAFWCPSAFKRRIQCLAFCNRSARAAVESCLSRAVRSKSVTFFFANMLCQRISESFLCTPSCENRRMAPMFLLSCFLKHLLRLEKHYLPFRCTVLWSSLEFLMTKPGVEVKSQLAFWSVVGLRESFKFLSQLQKMIPISEKASQSGH